jgi:PPOX class probable F420-dependent enzyme, Rv3369 family
MSFQLPDPATPFGERVARRLHNDPIIWLTTVDAKGIPQPNPVWFLWDDATQTILIYSKAYAKREAHIKANPRVSLNFDGNGKGGDIIVITGEARFSSTDPSADKLPSYVQKYQQFIKGSFGTPANFASQYPVAMRIHPLSIRGY